MSAHGSLLRVFASGGDRLKHLEGWRRRLRHFLIIVFIVASAVLLGAFTLALGPRLLGYSSFVVYGGSMEPAVRVGSMAVAKPTSVSDLRVGDIVAYKAPRGGASATLHRIVTIQDEGPTTVFTLKGDANVTADPIRVTLEGRGSRVIYSVPKIGYLTAFARTGRGRVILLWLPAFGLAGLTLWEIWAPRSRQGQGGPWRWI